MRLTPPHNVEQERARRSYKWVWPIVRQPRNYVGDARAPPLKACSDVGCITHDPLREFTKPKGLSCKLPRNCLFGLSGLGFGLGCRV